MIGTIILHYKIIEKIGEGGPTTLRKKELRRADLSAEACPLRYGDL